MNDNKNLSADLVRVGEFLYKGNVRLAEKFIEVCEKKYVFPRKWRKVFLQVKKRDRGNLVAADAALTLGRLIWREGRYEL